MAYIALSIYAATAAGRDLRLRPRTILVLAVGCLLLASAAPAQAAKPDKPDCADRIDNDGDGLTDYDRGNGDPDCLSRKDMSEAVCGDDDGDGQIDQTGVLPHVAAIACVGSLPRIARCELDYHDINEIVSDGCEYGPVRATGPEICDGIDNDADGRIDEETNPFAPHGTRVCVDGTIELVCDPGYTDVNGQLDDGCEVAPAPTVEPEKCDGLDNDADGAVDEELTYPAVSNGFHACAYGSVYLYCDAGYSDLNGIGSDGCEALTPPPDPWIEQCDGLDNDQDGIYDEGVVFPQVPNGELVCHQGSPRVLCYAGFVEASSDPYDGCQATAGRAAFT